MKQLGLKIIRPQVGLLLQKRCGLRILLLPCPPRILVRNLQTRAMSGGNAAVQCMAGVGNWRISTVCFTPIPLTLILPRHPNCCSLLPSAGPSRALTIRLGSVSTTDRHNLTQGNNIGRCLSSTWVPLITVRFLAPMATSGRPSGRKTPVHQGLLGGATTDTHHPLAAKKPSLLIGFPLPLTMPPIFKSHRQITTWGLQLQPLLPLLLPLTFPLRMKLDRRWTNGTGLEMRLVLTIPWMPLHPTCIQFNAQPHRPI
mmetsp:Transcript_10899/g.14199  ORF Transcript_10899/g.14199 Transcript_10899/m.14199 type:complete len:256 (+) Transcript_10899:588-1355(+)